MVTTEFEMIEKEQIAMLRFPESEVLTDNALIRERNTELQKAMVLGNLEHSKIRIYFEDETSRKMVETTVWAVTDKRVILKRSVGIPISRIYTVAI